MRGMDGWMDGWIIGWMDKRWLDGRDEWTEPRVRMDTRAGR